MLPCKTTKRFNRAKRAISSRGLSRYARWNIIAWWLTSIVSSLAAGQSTVIDREYAIKAVFLYHFSTYVEWPPEAFSATHESFAIGVFGPNPFGTTLDKVAHKKKVGQRAIEIRLVDSVEEALLCQILFIPKSVPLAEQNAVLQATVRRPVLVVGESEDFVERGGNVQFFLEGNRVRFAFGAEAIKRDDLKISSKLLALAKIISTH